MIRSLTPPQAAGDELAFAVQHLRSAIAPHLCNLSSDEDPTMTGDRSKTIEMMRERYSDEYRRIYGKKDRIALMKSNGNTSKFS